jgi:outer membrane protein assembly factor BamB
VSDKNEETDIWRCLDAATGKPRWEFSYPAPGKMDYTSAPRATPVISGDDVYLFSALGQLHCVSLRDGAKRWSHDLLREYRGELPTWGYCATPLLVDDLVIVPGAATNAFLVAFDRHTGALRWKTSGGKPSYGNFICTEFGKRRQIVGCDADGAGGWDPKTGKRLWKIESEYPAEFKVPTPLKCGERVLLAAEQSGARLHAFDANGCAVTKPVAQNPDANPDVTSPVEADGVIWLTTNNGVYCLDGNLKVVWQLEEDPFKDPAQLIAGNGRVLVLTNKGTLALLPSRPVAATKPQLLSLVKNAESWSQPALVRGRLYVRTDAELLCVSLPE